MEPKPVVLGSSLPVPWVLELAKESLTTVPPRYVRTNQDSPFNLDANSSAQIPVINMQKLFPGEYMDSELEKFHQACEDWGFQLINHGVSSKLVARVKLGIQDFFNLPLANQEMLRDMDRPLLCLKNYSV